jgi:hypothetical protein
VNGEGISAYEFGSAEEADAGAEGVSASGSSIVTTFADGTGISTMVSWVESPHFYKAGKLIVLYVGCDRDVIDVLQETMGPQFAGGAGVGVHGVSVAGHRRCPDQAPPTAPIVSHDGPVKDDVSIELTLRAEPVAGEPLTVRLIAELIGGPDNNRDLYCPGEEWQFGDGTGMATSASCIAWTPSATIRRHFEQTYTYEKAGTYEVTFTYGPLGPITTMVEVR